MDNIVAPCKKVSKKGISPNEKENNEKRQRNVSANVICVRCPCTKYKHAQQASS